jgi:hypothetical protein
MTKLERIQFSPKKLSKLTPREIIIKITTERLIMNKERRMSKLRLKSLWDNLRRSNKRRND